MKGRQVMEHEKLWLNELVGKTIRGVRPVHHDNDPVPTVNLMLTDGSAYSIAVADGVFFEACLINILRRAQRIHDVIITTKHNDTKVDVRSKSFPMLHLRVVNKGEAEFPLTLTRTVEADA